jgi:hypothetical protein
MPELAMWRLEVAPQFLSLTLVPFSLSALALRKEERRKRKSGHDKGKMKNTKTKIMTKETHLLLRYSVGVALPT